MKLFLAECRKVAMSLIFWLFIIVLVIYWYGNFQGTTSKEISNADKNIISQEGFSLPILREPKQSDKTFGIKHQEIPDKLIVGAVDQLIKEYKNNRYQYYPFSYVKFKTFSKEQQKRVKEILEEIAGLSEEQLLNLPEYYFPQSNGLGIIHVYGNTTLNKDGSFHVDAQQKESNKNNSDKTKHFISQVSYERFKELMLEMEAMIGDNSLYSRKSLIDRFGITNQTYQEAMEQYHTTIQKDKVTGAFARLFCDYMGLPVGLFPVFLVVFMTRKDRRAKMQELLYSRRISSIKLITFRYLAYVTMMLLPILLLSLESLFPLISFGVKHQIGIDYFGFVKYIFLWLLPVLMIVTAVGMCLTVLMDTLIAIAVQLIWWYLDTGSTNLYGDYSMFKLMLRNNSLQGYDLIQNNLLLIWLNRIILFCLACILLLITVWIYEQKRKGRFDFESWYVKCWSSLRNKLRPQPAK